MKKIIALIVIITAGIAQAMEEDPREKRDNNFSWEILEEFKECPELDKDLEEQLLMYKAITESLETEELRELNKAIENSAIVTWEHLPQEVLSRIFSFIPLDMKHLMLIEKKSTTLTKDRFFLQALAHTLVQQNLIKAIEILGRAIETDNELLIKAFFKAQIIEKVTTKAECEDASVQSFAQALIRLNKTVANKVFVKAAQKNRVPFVQAFLNAGIDINAACNSAGNNALMEASSQGHQEVAKILLDNDADVNAQNEYRFSPLHFATSNGQIGIVQLLLEHNDVNIEIKDMTDTTPLMIAAKLGYEPIVELLIAYGANVNAQEYTRHTALMFACRHGHLGIVKPLLAHGANACIKTQIQLPQNFSSMVIELILYVNGIKPEGHYGYTALMYACEEGHEIIVDELLKHSDINATNDDGLTALQCVMNKYAANPNTAFDKYKKIIDLLICNGASLPKKKSNCPIS